MKVPTLLLILAAGVVTLERAQAQVTLDVAQVTCLQWSAYKITNPQIQCAITRTTAVTHDIIRANVHRSPMYSGQIKSRGPRYCPSIEDKIVRFGERDGHQIFLEPEGLDDTTIYPNGISTSLPEDVQTALVASIPGLERARVVRPGYAIEYDHVDPRELDPRAAALALSAALLP